MTDTPRRTLEPDSAEPVSPQEAAHDDSAKAATLGGRILRSFLDLAGSIVFGMEDGTVSIFGLVFGVASAAPDSRAVLLAGATGAISAAVSMMAGTFLDVETANDQAATRLGEERARFAADPQQAGQETRRRLVSDGFSQGEAATVADIMGRHPNTRLKIVAAVDLGAGEATRQNPYVQSAWMFATDLFAAAVPVIPFAIFGLATARVVSLAVTFLLLVVLGIGRAAVGRRRILPTVAQTVGIATAAAVAGFLVGKLISLSVGGRGTCRPRTNACGTHAVSPAPLASGAGPGPAARIFGQLLHIQF